MTKLDEQQGIPEIDLIPLFLLVPKRRSLAAIRSVRRARAAFIIFFILFFVYVVLHIILYFLTVSLVLYYSTSHPCGGGASTQRNAQQRNTQPNSQLTVSRVLANQRAISPWEIRLVEPHFELSAGHIIWDIYVKLLTGRRY